MSLKRIRWGVRAVLILGVAASVCANVLHARDNPISQAIAAWPPLALLVTIELISRVPIHSRRLAVLRLLATATIAGIAAWVSYWHMAGVASRYGEVGASPYLLPLSVDGLVVVASICLVELAGRIRAAEAAQSVAQSVAQSAADQPAESPPAAATASAPSAAPDQLGDEPASGADEPDEAADQDVRQDTRTAQEVEAAVRAMRAADPRLAQRRIAAALMVPPTTVRRILRRTERPDVAQNESTDNEAPELEAATR